MRITCFVAVLLFASICLPARAQTSPAPADSTTETAAVAPPAHPATADQIREFLALTHTVDHMKKTVAQSIKTARITSAPYYTGGFWDDMEKAALSVDFVTPMISTYQKFYSEEDMAALISFFKSSTGERMLAAEPQVAAMLESTLRASGAEIGRQVGEKHKDEIERLMKQQQHPSTSPTIQLKP
jgi:uncharacterized protein